MEILEILEMLEMLEMQIFSGDAGDLFGGFFKLYIRVKFSHVGESTFQRQRLSHMGEGLEVWAG